MDNYDLISVPGDPEVIPEDNGNNADESEQISSPPQEETKEQPKQDSEILKLQEQYDFEKKAREQYQQELEAIRQKSEPNQMTEEEFMEIQSDPVKAEKFLDSIIQKRVEPLFKLQKEETRLSQQYSDYSALKPQLDSLLANYTPHDIAQPGFMENAYLIVKGKESDRLIKEAEERGRQAAMAEHGIKKGASLMPSAAGKTKYVDTSHLSEAQKRAAQMTGMSLEEYVRFQGV